MRTTVLLGGTFAASLSQIAVAAAVVPSLGRPLGFALGGRVLGSLALGQMLPFICSGVLLVGASSLAIGIYLIRRKNKR